MASNPEDITGHVIVVAHITAKPGKADELEKITAVVRDHALSDKEPGTLVYRVTRFGDEFATFEEYVDAAAVRSHIADGPVVPLVLARKDELLVDIQLAHYKEF